MTNLIICLGTRNFLNQYLTNNSILAENCNHTDDFILLLKQSAKPFASAKIWQPIFSNDNQYITSDFELIYINLNKDNRSLLISKKDKLPQKITLYSDPNSGQLLIFSDGNKKSAKILSTLENILALSESNLNAAIKKYQIVH